MSLSELQQHFAQEAALLIVRANHMGYEVTLGEALRTAEQAAWDCKHGTGIENSLHIQKLALDLNFFRNGEYVQDGSSLSDIGEWWEARGPDHYWGGRFNDGNHFSISPDGGKTR